MITAPVVNRLHDSKDPYTEMPSGVNIVFYDRMAMVSSTLSAEYGKNEEKKELMYARGNVKLSNIKDENLYAEELYWNQKTKKIYSDKFVKIITPKETIYGQGFESNEDFSNYSIKKIKGVISSDKLKKE
jgi:LPS export ABC transporter protein LptC